MTGHEPADLPLGVTYDHAAMAARRIRDLLPLYRDVLGGVFYLGGDNARVGYRAVQLEYPGGGKVELMEPLPDSTFLDSFFARHPRGGVHHVTFTVAEDMEIFEVAAALERSGYRAHGVSTADPDWHEAFLHPRETHGTLVQIARRRGTAHGRATDYTLDDVLAGRAPNGCGVPSP
ncbi:VOC family protein [Thermobifida halotolerans]|uniref:VOC family protein n=1 Tax=Thermobifida halotolerans TaxID=483545 RepID=A0A399G1X3_9ACTN|nr:VOC family protein [Thermobifida halotolerans]UOE21223.1 VOC family protein [Thermobifida halotolerans]